ncbi:MAG: formylglycine-generating enzyme family protein, partial [Candidatus Electrothrix sp. ATG1]|nr:formylglycine-generating enzyme family protein [Candidatus Electrothrix sp. ATG1]
MSDFFVILMLAIYSVFFLQSTEAAEHLPDAPQPNEVWKDTVSGLEFVWQQGGCFQLGSRDPSRIRLYHEKPLHTVCLGGFWMGKYEVTNGQYRQFRPEHNSGQMEKESLDQAAQPVVFVSWHDAKAYTDWLTRKRGDEKKYTFRFRLPTEAEWEFENGRCISFHPPPTKH